MLIARLTVPLLVRSVTSKSVDDTRDDTQNRKRNRDAVSGDVLRRIVLEEGKGGDDSTNVSETNLPGRTNRATVVAAKVHVEPTNDDRHGGVSTGCDEEERCVLKARIIVNGDEDAESDDGNANCKDGEAETMAGLVRDERNGHGKAESHSPRRNGVQLCLNRTVAVSLDDTRREVGVAVSRHNKAKVHESSNDDLVVLEDVLDVLPGDAAITSSGTLVEPQTSSDVLLLVLAEPFGLLGEVGQQEPEEEADQDSSTALNDEDPPPAQVSAHTVQFTNGRSEKTAKCTSKSRTVEKERVPPLRLVSSVPHTNQVKRTRKHACLEHTQEEARGQQPRVVLHQTLQEGDQTEAEHVDGQPHGGLELLEQDVGGDLEEAVGHEEDDEGGVVFVVLKAELFGEVEDIGVGDVDTVCGWLVMRLGRWKQNRTYQGRPAGT